MTMKNEDQDWDDIHFGKDEPIIVDPNADPDDIDSQVVNDDDDILNAAKGKDTDPIPGDPAAAGAAGVNTNKKPDGVVDPIVGADQTGIELYLSQFDIEGGIIKFDDGTTAHFNDIEPAKQAEILQTLHSSQATSLEDKYGLDENEVGLLNYLRENNLSVEQMVDNMVQERIATMTSLQEMAAEDFTKMEPDALYLKFLKDTSPEATADQLATDLAKAKELANYNKLTENLRTQFITKQTASVAEQQANADAEYSTLVESQRQEIVNTVLPMSELAGITLDNNIKNTVLDHILETNDDGDSLFMDEVFSEPASLFKAAFWYLYGDAIVAQRDEFWKKEKSAAYIRGKEDALGISKPTPGKSFTTKKPDTKNEPHATRPGARTTKPTSNEDVEDWSDLNTE